MRITIDKEKTSQALTHCSKSYLSWTTFSYKCLKFSYSGTSVIS